MVCLGMFFWMELLLTPFILSNGILGSGGYSQNGTILDVSGFMSVLHSDILHLDICYLVQQVT